MPDVALAPARPWALAPLLLGALIGAALQVRQPALWTWERYGALGWGCAAALCVLWWWGRRRRTGAGRTGISVSMALAAAGLLFAVCGLRASDFAAQALNPALEGRDLRVTGVIAAMPQPIEGGVRLRLAVEAAQWDGGPVQLPPLIDLGWYAGGWREGNGAGAATQQPGSVPALRAGERWQLTARLKAPHGERNPHGFDYELWLWGQGVQGVG